MLSYITKHSKQRKTTKVIKLQRIASIWWQKHQTNAKLQKWSYYDEIASIWRQNDQNNAKLQNGSNYNELHWFDVKTIKNVELRRKTFKTTQNNESDHIIIIASIWRQNHQNFWVRWQNYKSNQIIMHCNDLKSKRSKKLSYVPNLQKWSNYNELDRFDVKTIKTTQNYKRVQITINLHRFDI